MHWSAHHGRLSSASTGRFAALRLPLVVCEEKVTSLDGASMSISSSKSDIFAVLADCEVLADSEFRVEAVGWSLPVGAVMWSLSWWAVFEVQKLAMRDALDALPRCVPI